jgi:hypothetical protein
MKTLAYLNEQLELLKDIQTRMLSTQVKEDIKRVQECIEEVKELQDNLEKSCSLSYRNGYSNDLGCK